MQGFGNLRATYLMGFSNACILINSDTPSATAKTTPNHFPPSTAPPVDPTTLVLAETLPNPLTISPPIPTASVLVPTPTSVPAAAYEVGVPDTVTTPPGDRV